MSNKLKDILSQIDQREFATKTGYERHLKMQKIVIENGALQGDTSICAEIARRPELLKFFGSNSKTEVPIAGYINDRFISRRIDRLVIDDKEHNVYVMDYKTDIDKTAFREKYNKQLNEYAALLKSIYPEYKVFCYILWLNDFTLEKIS